MVLSSVKIQNISACNSSSKPIKRQVIQSEIVNREIEEERVQQQQASQQELRLDQESQSSSICQKTMFLKLISFQWEEESEYFVQIWKILKHKVYLTNS